MASLALGGWVRFACNNESEHKADYKPAGYPMAKNLRTKIPSSDTMVIHDVNPAVTEQFAKEVGNVEIAQNVREVAEKTVRRVNVRRRFSAIRVL